MKEDSTKCIQILLPALIETKEQEEMTELCKKSIFSTKYCLKVDLDTRKYDRKVAGVWNSFLDKWRGEDYDYLMIMANDTQLDPMAIDYSIETLEGHPEAGVCTLHVTRDLEAFKKGFGQYKRSGDLTSSYHSMDPANFIIRKGVIEEVGRIDETFPCEFVERDYWYRCNLSGHEWIEPKEVLNYHPSIAGTIGNDQQRLQRALRKYLLKWGGDAGREKWSHPYNNLNYDFTYAETN